MTRDDGRQVVPPTDPATRERRRDINDRFNRLRRQNLALWVVSIVLLSAVGFEVHASDVNCRAAQSFARQYDGYLDAQIQNALKSQLLSPEEKLTRIAQGQHFHAFQPRSCPVL